MVVCRDEQVSLQTFTTMTKNAALALTIFKSMAIIVTLTGLYIVFINYRQYHKPLFVKIVWIFITVVALLTTAQVFAYNSYLKDFNLEDEYVRPGVVNQLTIFIELFMQFIYWSFSREYFQATLRFYTMIIHGNNSKIFEEKYKKVNCIITVVKITFYLTIIIWFILKEIKVSGGV